MDCFGAKVMNSEIRLRGVDVYLRGGGADLGAGSISLNSAPANGLSVFSVLIYSHQTTCFCM